MSDERPPRTRGDRPSPASVGAFGRSAPPHTRGSTRPGAGDRAPGAGSPAHAGIDPPHPSRRSRRPWLPRTRGDRPLPAITTDAEGTAPPHTRGSTRSPYLARGRAFGSPAHAGIDPFATPWSSYSCRLPRTRGDRPGDYRVGTAGATAPPHTRGSTPRGDADRGDARGSPAHAGIDPSPQRVRRGWSWLPRTRGDRPDRVAQEARDIRAPPHTRGSTGRWCRPRRLARGSPAHAGIDPRRGAGRRPRGGLPRTRGDRPS